MASVIRMPAALAGATEGSIQTWHVAVGQTVAPGDVVADIETEKAVVEFPAEEPGTVGAILVEEGVAVDVGQPILVLLADGEGEDAVEAALAELGETGAPAPSDAPAPSSSTDATAPGASSVPSPAPTSSPAPVVPAGPAAAPEPTSAIAGVGAAGGERRFASPIVRRLAREHGVDLSTITGTGPGGRIVRRDLERLLAAGTGARTTGATTAEPATPIAQRPAAHTDIPLTGMRKVIARRLTESKSSVPHFYVTSHIRVDELLAIRRELNEVSPMRISVNDLVLKAVAAAHLRVPAMNAVWNGDSIRQYSAVDIAMAVAIPGGLVTPVVRGVDSLGIVDLARTTADLAERAKAGRLSPDELVGGAVSVSNLGMYGVDEFSAILNPPQSAILAVGAAKPRPVVGEDGQLTVATVMSVTLSADHRVIDGALAAEWSQAFVDLLEHPVRLLI